MSHPLQVVAWGSIQALAIGFLIGAERESHDVAGGRTTIPGLRDFMLIALTGSMASFLGSPVIIVLGFAGIVAMIAVRRLKDPEQHGITTELAALVTFWLGYMTQRPEAGLLALGSAVGVTIILMVKAPITRLVTEVISKQEIYDTIKFLAIVLIVYPLLPQGNFGPYDFFAPRTVWKFVILVASVSYVGYFLTRFMSGSRGLAVTGILGGIASTTATTTAFAQGARERPERWQEYGWAAVLANATQFPRVAVIIYAMNPAMARAVLPPLLAMSAAGFLLGLVQARRGRRSGAPVPGPAEPLLRNPFALRPALKFGVLFSAILFVSSFCSARFGAGGIFTSSFLGGLIDVDAVSISVAGLVRKGQFGLEHGTLAVLLALFTNALFKTGLAFTGGGRRFGRALALAFALMLVVGLVATLALGA